MVICHFCKKFRVKNRERMGCPLFGCFEILKKFDSICYIVFFKHIYQIPVGYFFLEDQILVTWLIETIKEPNTITAQKLLTVQGNFNFFFSDKFPFSNLFDIIICFLTQELSTIVRLISWEKFAQVLKKVSLWQVLPIKSLLYTDFSERFHQDSIGSEKQCLL